jgi:hypothetical protein
LFDLAARGERSATIGDAYRLERAGKGHQVLEQRRVMGELVPLP